MPLLLILAAALTAAPAPVAKTEPCSVRLKAAEEARDLFKVRLEEETERADAQNYLTHLELNVTKFPGCIHLPSTLPFNLRVSSTQSVREEKGRLRLARASRFVQWIQHSRCQ